MARNVSFPTLLSWYNDFIYADDKTNAFATQRHSLVSWANAYRPRYV